MSCVHFQEHDDDTEWGTRVNLPRESRMADLVLTLEADHAAIRGAKARGLMELTRQEKSANGRHYDIACAMELHAES